MLVGSSSVRDVIAWTTASDPARVDNAYWWGCTPAGTCGRGVELSCVPPLGGEDRRRQCPGPDHLVLTRPLTARDLRLH